MSDKDDINYTTVKSAAAYVLGANDYFLTLQALTGATAVTLPAPSAALVGRQYIVQKDASAQTVTITPASGQVDGAANTTLATGAVHAKIFMCDGTAWWTVSQL